MGLGCCGVGSFRNSILAYVSTQNTTSISHVNSTTNLQHRVTFQSFEFLKLSSKYIFVLFEPTLTSCHRSTMHVKFNVLTCSQCVMYTSVCCTIVLGHVYVSQNFSHAMQIRPPLRYCAMHPPMLKEATHNTMLNSETHLCSTHAR